MSCDFLSAFHSPAKIPGASPCEPSFESHRSQWMPWRPDAPTVLLESKDLSYNQKNWNTKLEFWEDKPVVFFWWTQQFTNQKNERIEIVAPPSQKKTGNFWHGSLNMGLGIHSIKEIFEDFLGFYGQFLGCGIFWGWDDGISEGVFSSAQNLTRAPRLGIPLVVPACQSEVNTLVFRKLL